LFDAEVCDEDGVVGEEIRTTIVFYGAYPRRRWRDDFIAIFVWIL
jgi:hypothetical protein